MYIIHIYLSLSIYIYIIHACIYFLEVYCTDSLPTRYNFFIYCYFDEHASVNIFILNKPIVLYYILL